MTPGRRSARAELERTCRRWGVLPRYRDALGKVRTVPDRSLRRILALLGGPEASGNSRGSTPPVRRPVRPIDVVTIAHEGVPPRIALHRPRSTRGATLPWSIRLEGGRVIQGSIPPVDHRPAPSGGRAPRREHLDVREPLPSGYHRLEVTTPSGTATSLLLTVPARPRAPAARSAPRAWGLFAPLYALHDRQTWGCGDFSALERFVAWAADHGATVVGTLPILSAFLDRPYDPSPYRPVSRTFWNEVFLDVTREPEYEGSEPVQRIVASADFQNELERLRSREYVDLRRVARLKRQVLEGMLAQLRSRPSRRSAELDRFPGKENRLAAYARFRAEMEVHRRPPRSREEAPSDPSVPTDREAAARADYHRYVQWLSTRQLEAVSRFGRSRNVDLYLDVPLGTHPQGFDAWWEGPAIVSSASIGVPPDPGFPAGQNWGIAPANPERLREEGYTAFVATVRKHLDIVRVLRIDHVMGIHRLFWILNGTRARDGA
ncbi:MAG: 4-alpha-glucanotransferase, partial [Thermoplasmata archaeon]